MTSPTPDPKDADEPSICSKCKREPAALFEVVEQQPVYWCGHCAGVEMERLRAALRGVPPEGGPRADALRDALERITEASMECSGLPNKWGEMLNAVVDAARALGAGTRQEEHEEIARLRRQLREQIDDKHRILREYDAESRPKSVSASVLPTLSSDGTCAGG